MKREKVCGVYKIENLINKKVYIGSSKSIYNRWNQHRSALRKNRHHSFMLQQVWNKYGETSFNFIIIQQCELNVINLTEQYWMDFYKSYNFKYGYNILPTAGSLKGHTASAETKLKMSITVKNRFKSKEYKTKFNLSFEKFRKPILQIDFHGNIIKEWESVSSVQRELNCDVKIIRDCCNFNNNRKSYIGYIWTYKDYFYSADFNLEYYLKKHNSQAKEVIQLNKNNDIINKYCSIYSASVKTGIIKQNILECCNGKRKSAGGFIWKVAEYNIMLN